MGLNNRGWDGKNPTINISVYCIQNTEKFSNKKSFLQKGGYFCIIRQNLTRKRAKSLILHIMKLHEIPYNFYSNHNEIT